MESALPIKVTHDLLINLAYYIKCIYRIADNYTNLVTDLLREETLLKKRKKKKRKGYLGKIPESLLYIRCIYLNLNTASVTTRWGK